MSTYPRMSRNDDGSWYCHDCRKIVILGWAIIRYAEDGD